MRLKTYLPLLILNSNTITNILSKMQAIQYNPSQYLKVLSRVHVNILGFLGNQLMQI